MMKCIVPLAGPDLYDASYGIKALTKIDDETLIRKAIHSRPWYGNGQVSNGDIIFVLRDIKEAKPLRMYLASEFEGSQTVILPSIAKGALLSAVAGSSIIKDFDTHIVVDLVDIVYESDFSPQEIFAQNENIGGILPYFKSSNEKYSYLEMEGDDVVRTAEKKVISDNASCGTYFYRNLKVFFDAVSQSIKNEETYSVKGNLFLCPSFNGIVETGMKVVGVETRNVEEISLRFK